MHAAHLALASAVATFFGNWEEIYRLKFSSLFCNHQFKVIFSTMFHHNSCNLNYFIITCHVAIWTIQYYGPSGGLPQITIGPWITFGEPLVWRCPNYQQPVVSITETQILYSCPLHQLVQKWIVSLNQNIHIIITICLFALLLIIVISSRLELLFVSSSQLLRTDNYRLTTVNSVFQYPVANNQYSES